MLFRSTFSFLLNVNRPPSINAIPITRQQGSPTSLSAIAVVSDPEDAANTLNVKVNGGSTATVNDVTISGLSVDSTGTVRANVVAACGAANTNFTLLVTDSGGLSSSVNLPISVTPNTPPMLGVYPATTIHTASTTSATVTPFGNIAPSDNGTISSLTATAPGFTGSLSVHPVMGIVSISNAGPPGTYTVTVKATDSCGAITTRQFSLTVTL